MKSHCTHRFVATSKKGFWTVKVRASNGRGSTKDEVVSTTVFKCADCGTMNEYPDSREKNYIFSDLRHGHKNNDGEIIAKQNRMTK